MPGSPLSAAEVLRTDLFCGPVDTAMRKQKLKSPLRGRRAGGTAWAAAPSLVVVAGGGGGSVRPGSGLEPGEDTSRHKQRERLGKQTTGGRRCQRSYPPASGQDSRLVGAGRKAAAVLVGNVAGWSCSRGGLSGHP